MQEETSFPTQTPVLRFQIRSKRLVLLDERNWKSTKIRSKLKISSIKTKISWKEIFKLTAFLGNVLGLWSLIRFDLQLRKLWYIFCYSQQPMYSIHSSPFDTWWELVRAMNVPKLENHVNICVMLLCIICLMCVDMGKIRNKEWRFTNSSRTFRKS